MKDRIRLSTMCLFLCAVVYAGVAWEWMGRQDGSRPLGMVLAVIALAVYGNMAVLAIDLKRWAWQASNVVLALHILGCLAFAARTPPNDWKQVTALVVVLALGPFGLWANLRSASRAALTS